MEDEDFDPTLDEFETDNEADVEGDEDSGDEVRSQADYTRMTQDVARKRKEVEAREAALAERLSRIEALEQKLESLTQVEDEFLDPDEARDRRIAQIEGQLAEARAREQFIADAESALKAANLSATPVDVAEYMVKNNIQTPASAVKYMALEAGTKAEADKQGRRAAATDAKKNLGVLGGSTSKGSESTPQKPKSIREAYLLAKQGITVG